MLVLDIIDSNQRLKKLKSLNTGHVRSIQPLLILPSKQHSDLLANKIISLIIRFLQVPFFSDKRKAISQENLRVNLLHRFSLSCFLWQTISELINFYI